MSTYVIETVEAKDVETLQRDITELCAPSPGDPPARVVGVLRHEVVDNGYFGVLLRTQLLLEVEEPVGGYER